ncbi:GntR family transcriptional regulator [Denitrobaculum tricleocarpae]|uniref:GntR family transcriptional regulator n=1 Tax=Denitrobaculum tricleocarpae TaxID=2591009 RepID=A0A545U2Y7_9PROT|nr:GntR family transcriptional regulator [Denitrobaculum tricleocarpae]TQV83845.1 GntR family transcriptional regulator [Denitrobaculum tricleocarpae]
MPGETMNPASVDRIYDAVRELAASYAIKPDERINEGTLAKSLGASRTPVREALNRLVAEELLVFQPGKGFFCRALDPQQIFNLYELRVILEEAAITLACERASDEDIEALHEDLRTNGQNYEGKSAKELVAYDEHFHETLVGLSGNNELVKRLRNINARIRFVRWFDMEQRISVTRGEHRQLLTRLAARDAEACRRILRGHIEKRLDQIIAYARAGYSALYLPDVQGPLAGSPLAAGTEG